MLTGTAQSGPWMREFDQPAFSRPHHCAGLPPGRRPQNVHRPGSKNVRIPASRYPQIEPPGLYWYHPHIHGVRQDSGVGRSLGSPDRRRGIERVNTSLAGLAEYRVFVIRDQDLFNPGRAGNPFRLDAGAREPAGRGRRHHEHRKRWRKTREGPGRSITCQSPSSSPTHPCAIIRLRPGERQLWRILNASAITYLDLQFLVSDQLQALGVVALDSVPTAERMPRTAKYFGRATR